MENFKGTKGKWSQNRYSVFIGDTEKIGENIICRLHSGNENYQAKQQEANALLISKSPELLDLIKRMYDVYSVNERISGSLRDFMIEANNLIKQATTI